MTAQLAPYCRAVLGLLFVIAGILHFTSTNFILRMVPGYVPFALPVVYLSGVIEIVLGVLLALGWQLTLVRWSLVALLIAVFPANINMALHPELFPEIPQIGAWIRLPFQLIFIALVLAFT